MIHRFHVQIVSIILQIVICNAKNWMYSKSWIEDYRIDVKYGLPHQQVLSEYSMETHKIGIVQTDEERYLYEGHYDIDESKTILKSTTNVAVRNKGEKFMGQLISDLIIVPKNLSHSLPSVRVDMILLNNTSEGSVNFIGLLENPENDNYFGLTSSIRKAKKNTSISYEFVLCGNNRWKSMLSIGYVEFHDNSEFDPRKYVKQDVAVIDRYLFTVVVKSIVLNDTSLATCQELNVRSPVFDNTVPGIYLPFTIFRRFMAAINDHANRYDFPKNMKIWERRKHACFEGPVDWRNIPKIRFELFSEPRETVVVTYSGPSLVKRYYTENREENTYCYIFAIRKADNNRLIFGRAAFEGVRLIFNRTGQKISFVENKCCGPSIKLRRNSETIETLSSCLQKKIRSETKELDTYWIWVMVMAIILAILACLLSIPKSLHRGSFAQPTIHIFIPQTRTFKRETNCHENCTDPTE